MKNHILDKVSEDRWQQAQAWEAEVWISTEKARAKWGKNLVWRLLAAIGLKPRDRGDDWNQWWADRFDQYRFLPPRIERAIELGCGPYTNMRLVLTSCQPREMVLSDPLIRTYLEFPLSFVRRMQIEGKCTIDDHAIEECPFPDSSFDLVLMINVLDHVRDADLCMARAAALLRSQGWLIIGQAMTDEQDLKVLEGKEGEIGHPIKVNEAWMATHLAGRFEPAIQRLLKREEGRDPEHHCGTFLFAGSKR
ncbi:MAG: methyltransferase domain-containing protein [bacterium]